MFRQLGYSYHHPPQRASSSSENVTRKVHLARTRKGTNTIQWLAEHVGSTRAMSDISVAQTDSKTHLSESKLMPCVLQ